MGEDDLGICIVNGVQQVFLPIYSVLQSKCYFWCGSGHVKSS